MLGNKSNVLEVMLINLLSLLHSRSSTAACRMYSQPVLHPSASNTVILIVSLLEEPLLHCSINSEKNPVGSWADKGYDPVVVKSN